MSSCENYLVNSSGDLLIDSGGDFLYVRSAYTQTHELPWNAQDPVDQTLTWTADVHKARDGSERRRSLDDRPRMSFRYRYLLDDEQQRQFEAMLRNDTDQSWKVPLWHKPFLTTGAATAGGTTVAGAFTNNNIQSRVYIADPDDLLGGEFADVASVTSGLLTISGTWANDYPTGSRVFPVIMAMIHPDASWTRPNAGMAQAQLVLIASEMWPTGGAGATVNTYQSEPILDRQPIVRADVNEKADRGVKILDGGALIAAVTGKAAADMERSHLFRAPAEDPDELRWWEAFLDTVRGPWKRFWCSTWRPDLELLEQPGAGATSIEVLTCPDFYTRWYQGGIVDLQLETSQGVIQRRITSVTDDGATQILALDSALPLGSLEVTKVSFLELMRMADGAAHFSHESTISTVALSFVTVADTTIEAPATYDDYDQSIQHAEPIDLLKFSGPTAGYTYRYTNYSRDITFGGDTYTALAGGIDYSGGQEGNLEGQDQHVTLPVSAQLVADYVREPNRSVSLVITRIVDGAKSISRVIFRGDLVSIAPGDPDHDRASLLITPGLGDPIHIVVPNVRFSPSCQNRLGDAVCQVPLLTNDSYRNLGVTVSAVSGVNVTISGHGRADGFFDNGMLIDTSGEKRRIVQQVGSAFTLVYPMRDLAALDTVNIYAGCRKRVSVCRDKFSNIDNNVSFAFVPRVDVVRRGLRSAGS